MGSDGCVLQLSNYAEMAEGFGCHATVEINHNGKDAAFERIGRIPIAPSSIVTSAELKRAKALGRRPYHTQEMTYEKIQETIEKYAQAALRCKKAGMKMVFVHGEHGNLISAFASPLYNKRSDEYGGSLENRARFACEVLDRIRVLCGENFVIEYRISADEFVEGGMHFPETLKFIDIIQDKIDIVHISAGIHGDINYFRYWDQNYLMEREFNVHFAADVKKAFPKLLVNTVGSIMSIDAADRIIGEGKADFVSMCRPLIAEPEMPRKYALGKEADHRPCLRCKWCSRRLQGPRVIACAVNPMSGNTTEFPDGKVPKADVRKRVGVVGGGPAGIQAMLTLTERGHDVTLYEKSGDLGGQLIAASTAPFKQDTADYLRYLRCQAEKCGGRILLNTEATPEILNAENYDALIIANGASPVIPESICGIHMPHVHWAADVETGKAATGDNVAVIGAGAVGAECALHLAMNGKKVTLLEKRPDIMNISKSGSIRKEFADNFKKYGVELILGCELKEVKVDRIVYSDVNTGEEKELMADTVLLALGMTSNYEDASKLRRCAPETEVYLVGDVREPATIGEAVNAAFNAAVHI